MLQRRNSIAVIVKNVPARFLLRNLHRIAARQLLSLAHSARARMLGVHLRAWLAVLPMAPQLLRARRQILGASRIEPASFERFVSRSR
jgi:hypothetical protein